MATANQSTPSVATGPTMTTPSTGALSNDWESPNAGAFSTTLVAIYSVVLVSGTISLCLMMRIMKSSTTSITSIAVLNLMFTHFLFLLTMPFRIYYYSTNDWALGLPWCKAVSSMIHIHMYMAFIFYVIILITRLMMFYHKDEQVASCRKLCAFLCSAAVWVVVLIVAPCIIYYLYGKSEEKKTMDVNNSTSVATYCFKFGKHIDNTAAKVFNYIVSTVIITVALLLTALQANVLRVLYRKHRQACTSQQEFWAHLKSLCFALIMVVCFVPYHLFRLNYLENLDKQEINEVFLSLTTFSCLDMLTFLGRRTFNVCFPFQGKAI